MNTRPREPECETDLPGLGAPGKVNGIDVVWNAPGEKFYAWLESSRVKPMGAMTPPEPKRVVVIGGGIAGLAAAYYAQTMAEDRAIPMDLTLLEKDDQWGGKIRTERVDHFVIEGGPDTFLASKPWAVSLCRDLGLESRLQGTDPDRRTTYVLSRGRLQPLPEGLSLMIPSRLGPMVRTHLLSWPDKARMALDLMKGPAPLNGDESLGGFITRRLGRPAYERLIEPLMSGIYAGDGDRLSLQATFPYLRELELKHGGLIRGALAARPKSSKGPKGSSSWRSSFLTPVTGLAEIVEALVQRLGDSGAVLRLGAEVSTLTLGERGFDVVLQGGERLAADAVVLATPAFAAAELLAGLDPGLSSELGDIEYVPAATISSAYRSADIPRPLDGYGYVIPRSEGRKALACTWTSTKFPHRAPEGSALLRVFVGRAGQKDEIPWTEDGLLDVAREELRLTMGIKADPLLTRVFLWGSAMPQYNLGHPERQVRIDLALKKWHHLALAGSAYGGVGIPDCIHSGRRAAERALSIEVAGGPVSRPA